MIDDKRSRVDSEEFSGLMWFLVVHAILLDAETRSDGVVAFVVDAEESILCLGEVSGDIKVDSEIITDS